MVRVLGPIRRRHCLQLNASQWLQRPVRCRRTRLICVSVSHLLVSQLNAAVTIKIIEDRLRGAAVAEDAYKITADLIPTLFNRLCICTVEGALYIDLKLHAV